MNRGQLVDAVARKLSFVTDVGSDELAFLQQLANEAVVDVLFETHCYYETGTMTLTAGDDTYRTDPTILDVISKRINTSTVYYPFERVSLQQIRDFQNGVSPTAAPPGYFALEGSLLVVWPAPAAADVITWDYVPRPTDMTDDAHDPSSAAYGGIPTWAHGTLEYYMLWQAAEEDDKAAVLNPDAYFQRYQERCAKVRVRIHGQGGHTFNRPAIGYPGRRHGGRRNDVYPDNYGITR